MSRTLVVLLIRNDNESRKMDGANRFSELPLREWHYVKCSGRQKF